MLANAGTAAEEIIFPLVAGIYGILYLVIPFFRWRFL